MKRRTVIAACVLMAACTNALAAPLDDAKQAVAGADKKLSAATVELKSVAKALAQQVAAVTDVSRQLDRQRQLAPLITRALETANEDLASARTEATAAERTLRDAETSLTKANADLAAKRAAVERAAGNERQAFEASAEYRAASAKVDACEAAVARERSRFDAVLKADPEIAALTAAVEKAKVELTTARAATPPDDAAVAEASAAWIDATNALRVARNARYEKDGAYVDASAKLADETNARTALSDAFDKSILTRPGVAEAQLALRDASSAMKAADAAASSARDEVARVGRWLRSRRDNADAMAKIAREVGDNLANATADLKRSLDLLRATGQQLTTAITHTLALHDDLQTATGAITAAGKTAAGKSAK